MSKSLMKETAFILPTASCPDTIGRMFPASPNRNCRIIKALSNQCRKSLDSFVKEPRRRLPSSPRKGRAGTNPPVYARRPPLPPRGGRRKTAFFGKGHALPSYPVILPHNRHPASPAPAVRPSLRGADGEKWLSSEGGAGETLLSPERRVSPAIPTFSFVSLFVFSFVPSCQNAAYAR